MIAVCCWGKKKGNVKVLAKFSDSEEEVAIEVAKDLAKHNKGEVLVCLIINNTYKILKRIKKGWKIEIPTLRHPFRYPSRGVQVR